MSSSSSAHLLARQDNNNNNKCADSSFTACSIPLLPSNFCCPSNTKCIPLNRQTSMICCPAGQDCQFIQPITCDISLQNATAHPRNPVQSTNLTATLPACGSGCCPLGYECRDGQCMMDKSISGVVNPSSSSSSGTLTSSSSSSSTKTTAGPTLTTPTFSSSSSSTSSTSISTTTPAAGATESLTVTRPKEYPTKAILASFFPGLALGILLTLAIVFILARRKRNRISAPIYQGDTSTTARTDFLRRRTRSKTFSRFSRPGLPSFSRPGTNSGLGVGMRGQGAGNSVSSPPPPPQMMMTRNGSITTRTPLVRSTSLRSDTASIDLVFAHDDSMGMGMGIPPLPEGSHQLHVAQAGSSSTYSPASHGGPLSATTFNGGGGFVGARNGPPPTGFLSPTYPPPPTVAVDTHTNENNRQNQRGISQMTAFTDLMETAGFRKGEPFVVHTERERDPGPPASSAPRHGGGTSANAGASGSGSGGRRSGSVNGSANGSFGKNSTKGGGGSATGSGGRNRWQQH
ncbi:MAG: hypothetical protein M1823_003564 [Watsoniomyces obsoletus]|nr:MAG: hypothetical protein M1823_003564 [Watsoniomyces obsoletus]